MFEKQLYLKTDLIEHTNLALKTDLIVVYPATMSFISKATLALADSLVLATFLAAPVPKILFSAMNHFMYHNKNFQNNLLTLVNNDDVTIIKPETGMLACNIVGEGRLPKSDLAYQIITKKFSNNTLIKPY